MGFLGTKTKTIPAITGLQIQTAVNVLPVPIGYGSPRTQMNIIYANGFRSVAVKQSGGKGLLSGGKGNSGFKYFATFIGALGEGPTFGIPAIFDNQAVYTLSNLPPGRQIIQFDGSDTQTPAAYIVANWPADAFSYKDTAYLLFDDNQLDSTATLPQLNFIVQFKFNGTSPLNLFTDPTGSTYLFDADPALCINDFLTNVRYGAGFPAAYIDTTTLLTSANGLDPTVGDAAVSTYCQAVGLAWSLVLNNTEPASSILDRWCKNLTIAPVWTGSKLKFIPYWDAASSANPGFYAPAGDPLKYYAPDIPVLFDLTDNDFIQPSQGEDPVVVSRVDIADVKNVVRLDFRDRYNLFNSNVVEAKDDNAVELYGPRVDRMGTADEFTLGAYAATAVQIRLQRNLSVRDTFTFRLAGWQGWCILEPMDIVTLTDATLGLSKRPVRITSVEEDEKGILTIIAEEFPIGAISPTVYHTQGNTPPVFAQTNVVPKPVNTPVIFEPTTQMLTARGAAGPVIVVGACAGPSGAFDPNWGGCNVFVSNDNITYVEMQPSLGQPSRMGLLTADIPAFGGSNPDNVSILQVSLVESNATLDTVTSTQAAAGLSLCAVVDTTGNLELLSYTVAALIGPNSYNLSGLYRGLYGTTPIAHAHNSQFLRIDTQVFEAPLPSAFINKILYLKLQSFNVFNQEAQDISTCAVYTYLPLGLGTDLALNPIGSALMAGQFVDLGHLGDPITANLDLNAGGPGTPVVFAVDLGVLP